MQPIGNSPNEIQGRLVFLLKFAFFFQSVFKNHVDIFSKIQLYVAGSFLLLTKRLESGYEIRAQKSSIVAVNHEKVKTRLFLNIYLDI